MIIFGGKNSKLCLKAWKVFVRFVHSISKLNTPLARWI